MTIVEFLEARLTEEEQIAHAADVLGQIADTITTSECDEFAEHIARHDPARVLRNVEAKKRILALHRRCVEVREQASAEDRRPDDRYDVMEQALGMVLSSLAAEWSDHPDFDPRWVADVEEWLDDSE